MTQYPDVFESTKAIFFLGTPHRGSHVLEKIIPQLGLKLAKLVNMSIPQSVNDVLKPRADDAFFMNTNFVKIGGRIAIVNFYEQMALPGLNDLVSTL